MCVRFRSMAKSIDGGTIMLCTFAMTTVFIFLFLFCLLLFYLVFENNHFIFHWTITILFAFTTVCLVADKLGFPLTS